MTNSVLATTLIAMLSMAASAVEAPRAQAVAHTEPSTHAETTPTAWSSGTYEYDGAGNIKKIGTDVYRYDPMGRLVGAAAGTTSSPINHQAFVYDRYANLKTVTTTTRGTAGTPNVHVRAFAVNQTTNHLDDTCTAPFDTCQMAIYDPAGSGNQTGRDTAGQYTWDAVGMMVHMTERGERYVYDASDERVVTIETLNGSTARYTLRGVDNKVTRALTFVPATSTWSLAKDHIYRGGALLASFAGTQAHPDRHYHLDHLGTTRLVTDAIGQRLAVHTYWPFGLEADGSDAGSERLKFTGHERDSSNGAFVLDYMHARYYDPNMGRFLSTDPGRDWNASQPQSWNLYSYVSNNPVNRIDPTGKWKTRYHDAMIEKAFPGLSNADRAVLKAGSSAVDSVMLGGQMQHKSHEHAMREGGDTVAASRAKSAIFYDTKISEARTLKARSEERAGDGTGRSEALAMGALNATGAAMHLVADDVSPEHSGQQVWGLITHPVLAIKHMINEGAPTPEEEQLVILRLQSVYGTVYGEEAQRRATMTPAP